MIYRFFSCCIFFTSLSIMAMWSPGDQPSESSTSLKSSRLQLRQEMCDSREKWRSLRFLSDNRADKDVVMYCQSRHISIDAIYVLAEAYRLHENAAAAVIDEILSSAYAQDYPNLSTDTDLLKDKEKLLEESWASVLSHRMSMGEDKLDFVLEEIYTPTYLLSRPAEMLPKFFPPKDSWPKSLFKGFKGDQVFLRTPSWREDTRNRVVSSLKYLLDVKY